MKFRLIETLQTANGKAFTDDAGNVWQALALYNVTTKNTVYMPATVAACKTLTVDAMRHKGRPVIDQANYLRWCERYSMAPIESRQSFWGRFSSYIAAFRASTVLQPVTVRQ